MKKILTLLFIFLISIFLYSCREEGKKETTPEMNNGKKDLLIVTSFYPVYISAINIIKDIPGVRVVNLTGPVTGCLHDYEITTEEMKKLSSADIFVINGAGMESFIDKVIKQLPDLKIVEASKGIELIKTGHDEDGNPHVWVSVLNVIKQVNNISESLEHYDPGHKELYRKNAEIYINKLENLHKEMTEELKDLKNRDIITFHEAFPYFAKEFNLNIIAVIERDPGSEPGAKELAETIEIVKKSKVKALFTEPQYPQGSADVIAKETGAKVFVLDPGVTGAFEYDGYINIMKENLKVLKEALK